MVILFGFFAHAHYTWRVITVIPSILQLYAISLGVALLLGSLYVYFRDIGHIWDVILQALFYATPIIYPLSMVQKNPEFSWAADFMMLMPTTQTIMDIRHNLLSPEYVPTIWTVVDNKILCLIPTCCPCWCCGWASTSSVSTAPSSRRCSDGRQYHRQHDQPD